MTIRLGSQQEAESGTSWHVASAILFREVKRLAIPIVILAVLFATLGLVARMAMPQTYRATAELLIDPRGLQVFKNELVAGQYDANAAVNYVESQIHVILSTRVLSQALQRLNSPATAQEAPRQISAAAIDALRRNIVVSRAERSYILAVTAKASTPQGAAEIANAVLDAYLAEDITSRTGVAERLTDELGSRLAQLRARVAESEERAEAYRQQNNLVSTDDKPIIEQQLAAAVMALGQAEERLSAARARHQQITSPNRSAIDALASSPDQARLNLLVSRRVAAHEELARLSIRLGNRHPSLLSARSQLAELESLVQAEHARIRSSSETVLRQAQEERDGLQATVAMLTRQSGDARESSIELRALEQQVVSDRELLSSFETRSREMAEFAHIDSANVRVLSTAYPPEVRGRAPGALAWAMVGAVLGLMAGIGWAVLRTLIRLLGNEDAVPAAQPVYRPQPAPQRATERAVRPRGSLLSGLPPAATRYEPRPRGQPLAER